MKQLFGILALSTLTSGCDGQDFQAEFGKYCEVGDTTKQFEILTQWENVDPKNAELFTSYFNYYFSKSKQEILSISTGQPDGESLSLQDSAGKTAGFIGSSVMFLNEPFEKGLHKIDQGLKLYPNRLDMRFGKIHALGQFKDWKRYTDEIVKAIQYSVVNNNRWTWTNNKREEGGKKFFLSSLQDYQLTLYNTGNDDLLVNMRKIANEILKVYPDHVESLSNLSITYLLTGEYDKGIEPLLKAEKIDSTDAIVLSNIAQGYKLKGVNEMAIIYYKKVIVHGDEKISDFARQQIVELKK